ncbi:MarR family winged helix-turn-helix transcriptional regulator [Paenibacillus wynnii]|uniref:MarR family winged helix-turn-helix transcriptional regulator n=1 Tax=Paenibacillus wynnii TaxID=268407 RepID=UPI00278CC45E|nr:MarR family transcriptional regulator [Paenibacillus wynnii]MDQ0193216.1 DNA-binding MarR family transcriptional regulator [Paenibacillus wynnii]
MNKEAQHWINRYMDAYLVVTRRINAQIRDSISEELTSDQYLILRLIQGQELCTSTHLAESFAVGKSSITAMTNRLVEAGMIERTRDENDRRQVYLSMTEYGKSIFDAAEKQVQEIVSPYLFHFEESDIEMFIRMFEKLGSLMQDSGGKNN